LQGDWSSDVCSSDLARESPDLVVATAAVHDDNPELAAAKAAGIAVVSRADFLGQLMDEHAGPTIAVAGTHGKTTTTAMAAEALKIGRASCRERGEYE